MVGGRARHHVVTTLVQLAMRVLDGALGNVVGVIDALALPVFGPRQRCEAIGVLVGRRCRGGLGQRVVNGRHDGVTAVGGAGDDLDVVGAIRGDNLARHARGLLLRAFNGLLHIRGTLGGLVARHIDVGDLVVGNRHLDDGGVAGPFVVVVGSAVVNDDAAALIRAVGDLRQVV